MSERKAATEAPIELAPARRAAAQPPATVPARLLALQRTAGNRAAAHAVAASRLARTPTHVSEHFTEQRTGTLASIRGTTAFDIDFTPLTAELTVKIKLTPDAGIPTTDVDRVKADAESNFARLWDSKFLLTDDRTEEPFLLHARVVFVTTGEHLGVRLKPGDGPIDQTTWHVADLGIEYAHEISHTLGLKDEYVDPLVVNRRTSTSPGVFEDHSIMGNYFNEGIPQAEVKLRHGEALAAVIGRATHRRYRVAFTGYAQGDRLVRWRGIRDAELPGSSARTAAAAEVEAIERDMLIPEISAAAGRPYVPTP
jgi:hypothetical protein